LACDFWPKTGPLDRDRNIIELVIAGDAVDIAAFRNPEYRLPFPAGPILQYRVDDLGRGRILLTDRFAMFR